MKITHSLLLVFVILLSCAVLTACGCAHEYDNGVVTREATCTEEGIVTYTCGLCGETNTDAVPKTRHEYTSKITKKATFSETGLITYTCSLCADSYTEETPIRTDEAVVTVIDKLNIPEDIDNWRFSDRVEFMFSIENMTDKDIKGVQGILTIQDLFGKEILQLNCNFTGKPIPAYKTVPFSDLGIDINEFIEDHVKLYNQKFDDLVFTYDVSQVVYTDSPSPSNSSNDSLENQKAIITVTDKINIPEDIDNWRFSDRVEFVFHIQNMTDKDIKGVQGTLSVLDLFGVEIIQINCDFTGKPIPAHESISFSDLGIDINEFMNDHVQLYNEEYDDLNFDYAISSIVYTDGTTE